MNAEPNAVANIFVLFCFSFCGEVGWLRNTSTVVVVPSPPLLALCRIPRAVHTAVIDLIELDE